MEVGHGNNGAMWPVMEGSFSQSCGAWQNVALGTEEMPQQIRVTAALPEDHSLGLSAQVR